MFKNSVLVCLGLTLLAVYAEAGGSSARLYGNKKHPTLEDHCYYESDDLKVTVKMHETAFPTNVRDKCVKIECLEDFVVHELTCTPHQAEACLKGIDITKPFPDCCPCH